VFNSRVQEADRQFSATAFSKFSPVNRGEGIRRILQPDRHVFFLFERAGWVEPFAKPIILAQNMMGIASLNPSYGLAAAKRTLIR